MEILTAEKIERIMQALDFKDAEAEQVEDLLLNRYLRYIHVLGKLESKVIEEDKSIGIQDLFYSRYYWFHQFKERYFALYGHDEGLEQQSFKMLSDFNELFPEEMEWGIIEQIEGHVI